ncbi:hypothetical protein SAMN04488061_2416 [Filomicrobium insigne]|uniref:DUF6881 domain-containing protein n=1 Tax=Filomicrobium insigne TaxID=418854 RepID=A0A1H0QM54_9HYPH|nr:hypothetical protein [Filomicrobium insigne]SDP18135.1 hypothetical protein SAMN04488061_2416 [Filomicrobium insigne]
MRRYIRVEWRHDHPDEPVLLYSDLDDASFEVRKVEVFRDGSVGYADAHLSQGLTMLGSEPIPTLSEINADPEFYAAEITDDEFEEVWVRAISLSTRGN